MLTFTSGSSAAVIDMRPQSWGIYFYRDGKLLDVNYTCREVAGMKIREYNFVVHVNDCFVLMSDGVTHAGMPDVYPFGWGRTRVAEYVSQLIQNNGNVCMRIATAVIGQCREIYRQVPGDDATAMVVSVGKDQRLNILTGPPSRDELDEQFIHDFIGQSGLHVIAGGTSACIASRVLNRQLKVSLDYMDPDIPPVAQMEGIDLVIEGILTLNRTLKFLLRYNQGEHNRVFYKELDSKDGAARINGMKVDVKDIGNFSVGDPCTLVLRPESAVIADKGQLPCDVILSCFMGSYQNYHVMVGDTMVKITDFNPKNKKVYEVGDKAYVAFDPQNVHVL